MKKQNKPSKNIDKPFTFRGKYLLCIVALIYVLLFVIDSQSALLALQKGSKVLLKILPIFCVVIVCTALINYFLKPKQIAKHLGHDSGAKGWLWALLGGVISHGPMYAWYPLFEDLRRHGMKDALIAVFFASRTIKIPLLPIMIDYFGLTFTIILSCYILIGALIQGALLEMFGTQKET